MSKSTIYLNLPQSDYEKSLEAELRRRRPLRKMSGLGTTTYTEPVSRRLKELNRETRARRLERWKENQR